MTENETLNTSLSPHAPVFVPRFECGLIRVYADVWDWLDTPLRFVGTLNHMEQLVSFARAKRLRWCHAYDTINKRIVQLQYVAGTGMKESSLPKSRKPAQRSLVEYQATDEYVDARSRESWIVSSTD